MVCSQADMDYTIEPDVDTRDNSPIWIVKLSKRLNNADFKAVCKQISDLGGYYSRYKSGFIFKGDPREILKDLSIAG